MCPPSETTAPSGPAGTGGAISTPTPASVSLPKGGGAIRGIGEKFGTNPVTGTASMTVPVATSPGRSDFGPKLELAYDSGSGNGPFGFGWSLHLPSITRKTDRGTPHYLDGDDSDVFILSGSEDLVPYVDPNGVPFDDTTTDPGFTVRRYRPRIEGLFARIERWTATDGDVHWRSLSRDDVLTLYGADPGSRIADPGDPRRVFSWLVCESRDTVGNVISYEYKPEDGTSVPLGRASERNRGLRDDVRRTANRYLKRIFYCNRTPKLDAGAERPRRLSDAGAPQRDERDFLMEVVLDYGEHDLDVPTPGETRGWTCREDAFSSYRCGFEVRTNRLCRRILMFHHIPASANGWPGYDGLVHSTVLEHDSDANPGGAPYSFLRSVTHVGHKRIGAAAYLTKSTPPVEFEYSRAQFGSEAELVDPAELSNLPIGVDGSAYVWTDLHGEGVSGVLTAADEAWYYTRNLSPNAEGVAFGACEPVVTRPAVSLAGGRAQLLDLGGDGSLDVVEFEAPVSGFFEHDDDEGWRGFAPFLSRLNREVRDANVRFVDLDGDGHADVLVSEADRFVWYPSLGEAGFGPELTIPVPTDPEQGPRLVFADTARATYLADMSGDGLSDLLVVEHSSVSYYPNLGRRFGPRVVMDNPPSLDTPDRFDHRRLRVADIDGSGTSDLLYLHSDGVRIALNRSGNSWSEVSVLDPFPIDDVVSVQVTDLLGDGTACLVWSSAAPGDAGRPMRYLRLMPGGKPHLMTRTVNNLGAETTVHYASSTTFYLRDRAAGRPWLTRLAFPVHVVERVQTFDRVSRNAFATTYAYHHGYFDGTEREFRGFAMVEQFDGAEIESISGQEPTNADTWCSVPRVLTKTWFHTGAFPVAHPVEEFYREPGLDDTGATALRLLESALPAGAPADEVREAARALKGSALRQETYALDGTAREPHPYAVDEHNYVVQRLQGRGHNQHAVFHSRPDESLTYHYERDPTDPRVQHAIALEVDDYGVVLQEVSIAYGRRAAQVQAPVQRDRDVQTTPLITYTSHDTATAYVDPDTSPDHHRTPTSCATSTFELTGFAPSGGRPRFVAPDFVQVKNGVTVPMYDDEIAYDVTATGATRQRRLVERVRTLYRSDDLARVLPLGGIEPKALTSQTFRLALTDELVSAVLRRSGQPLLVDPAAVLGAVSGDGGGYRLGDDLKSAHVFPADDPQGQWWIPGGTTVLSPEGAPEDSDAELSYAARHFFRPLRHRDAFHTAARRTETTVGYDEFDLVPIHMSDAVTNLTTAGLRAADGSTDPAHPGVDYRVLQPALVTDANLNRTAVCFDALGMVVATASMGKAGAGEGDLIDDAYVVDLDDAVVAAHLEDPLADPAAVLGTASTRVIYDLDGYRRTKDDEQPQPAVVYTVARETHVADLTYGESPNVQHSLSFSDGFGREIQNKAQAEPGVDHAPRWVASGWSVFNNKGEPVRTYEPFFSSHHRFQPGVQEGVSSTLFYDPMDRVVATIHPHHTYEKVVFGPWHQRSYDVNDTVTGVPKDDPDIGGYVAGFFASAGRAVWPTWYQQRVTGGLGVTERTAAQKAALHADTPATAYLDPLGRTVHTVVDAGPDPAHPDRHVLLTTRVDIDIEGNQREVRDAIALDDADLGRVVMRYEYDMLGTRLSQLSMEAGGRWVLHDALGRPIRGWDSRGHATRTEYDVARRPTRTWVAGLPGAAAANETLTDLLVYGEQQIDAVSVNVRGKPAWQFDQAGLVGSDAFDFKGNALATSRRFTGGTRYRDAVDWRAVLDSGAIPEDPIGPVDAAQLESALDGVLDAETYRSEIRYDALNRPVEITTPHSAAMTANVVRHRFNEAGLLEQVDSQLRPVGGVDADAAWTPFVTDLEYDTKGQRLTIAYGNGVVTSYTYDPATFRLARLTSSRPADGVGPRMIQDLAYTYDPIGNVIRIEDSAQQTIFFSNRRVEPSCDYTYDALYHLIAASGREHLGHGVPIPHSWNDAGRTAIASYGGAGAFAPGDGNAMGRYTERYVYDAVGNLLKMAHVGDDPANPGWSRIYTFDEISLLEDGVDAPRRPSNRVTSTSLGGGTADETYDYDEHGNTVRMPHLGAGGAGPNLSWNHHDQISRVDKGGGGAAYYVHDARGERVRKVWEKPGGRVEERLYLGGVEIYRQTSGGDSLVRETLHVMDDQQRVAVVETRTADTAGSDPAPDQLVRYQLGNHLGSAVLEVDDSHGIISYEEYSPYGSSTYQAVRSATETPKRYRYTSKERDEETGFGYHSARYYAPWLGRWTSCDPSGTQDGLCLYEAFGSSPVVHRDPTGKSWRDFAQGALIGVGTAVVITVAIAAASITIPAAVAMALMVGGAAVTVGTLVQSARRRDLLNNPISDERADRQAGMAVGGLLVGGLSGPTASGLSAVSRAAASSAPALEFVGGATAAATWTPVSDTIPAAAGAFAAMGGPMLSARHVEREATLRGGRPSGLPQGEPEGPRFTDTNVLIGAARGGGPARRFLEGGQRLVSPRVLREFMRGASRQARSYIEGLVERGALRVMRANTRRALVERSSFTSTQSAIHASGHGTTDAELLGMSRAAQETSPNACYVGESRLQRFLTESRPDLGVRTWTLGPKIRKP